MEEVRVFDLMRDEARLGPTIRKGLEAMCVSICAKVPRPERDHLVMYEVGSYAGESAEIFARYFSEVHCVDPWEEMEWYGIRNAEDVEAEFDRRTAALVNVHKHKATSLEWAAKVQAESIDFVYVDAMHDKESVLADLAAWAPKVRKRGWIGGHDYLPQNVGWSQVMVAVDELFGGRLPEVFPDSSWLRRL